MNTAIDIPVELAKHIGDTINVDWRYTNLEQFRQGMEVELEHGQVNRYTDVTHDDLLLTGKIALAHLNELPDYYTRLKIIEDPNFQVPQQQKDSTKNEMLLGLVVGAGLFLLAKSLIKKKSH